METTKPHPSRSGGLSERGVRILWRAGLAVSFLFVLAYAAIYALVPALDTRNELAYGVELAASIAGALTVLFTGWMARASDRRLALAWSLMGLGLLSYSVADTLSIVFRATLADHPLSVPLNFFYLLFYPLFLSGVLTLPPAPLSRAERIRLFLDMGLVVLAAGLVHWTLLVKPLADAGGFEGLAKPILALAYPAGDLALLWAVMTLVFMHREPGTARVYRLMALSTLALIATDVAYSLLVLSENYFMVLGVSVGYVSSHLLGALAALSQVSLLSRPRQAGPPLSARWMFTPSTLLLAYACLAVAWIVVMAGHLDDVTFIGVAGIVAMLGLVLARQVSGLRENARLTRGLRQARDELELRVLERTSELVQAYDSTLQGWSMALELRDQETQGHTLRVAELTVRLARASGVPESELVSIRQGALLHDIGKMGIPDGILLKPGPLDEEEWALMRMHTEYARDLLGRIDFLKPAMAIPCSHHERWDGTGYPQGLQGEAIPLSARIFAVVDCYDALTHDRPYRAAWPPEQALDYVREQSGTHFDPRVVEAFLQIAAES